MRRINMRRRKLFSNTKSTRRKLFSESGQSKKTVICSDCGYKMETTAATTNILCPKCGGRRFNVERRFFSPEGTPEPVPTEETRISLFSEKTDEERFQKSFSETDNKFELKLKKYSGTSIKTSECERIFGVPATDLVEKGFAEISGDSLNINKDAFLQSRLFSKLIVSVTKVLDLDPQGTCGGPEVGIQKLENLGVNPKGIILLKKAHGICPTENPSWADESGILNDLPIEFGGRTLGRSEFERTLGNRYPDAPHNILDLLSGRGIIKINGDHIDIIK